MAVLQMQRIFICALKKDRKQILELLQRRGVIEISDRLPEDSVFHKTDITVAKNSLEKVASSSKEAINILNSYIPEKKSMFSALQGRREISVEDYDAFKDKHDDSVRVAHRIITLYKEIAENKAEIHKLEAQVEMLKPWMDLDIPLNFSGTQHTKGFIGILPNTWTLEAIYERLAEYTPLNVDIISASRDQTCIFVLCTRNHAEKVFDALRAIEFSLPGLTIDESPAKQLEILNGLIDKARTRVEKAADEIISLNPKREELLFLQDYDLIRAEKYEVIGHLLQSKNVFVLTGFIAKKDAQPLQEELTQQFDLTIEVDKPTKKDKVPVLLENNAFSRPLEGVLKSYSPPSKGEIDPTMVMSLFYYMLFGLMLSDVGYGGIITLACVLCLIKFGKTMEQSMKDNLRMYLFCGISTMFWGVMFGSYFSDIIDVVSETYFGNRVAIPALWFVPMNQPMRMLAFSMLIGIIHLFAGIGMKLYLLIKKRDIKSIIYDVLLWLVLLISSIILLLSMQMIIDILGVDFGIPESVSNAAGILAIIAAVGIVLTNGRESKNPFKRFLKGLFALYGISGYLSDVLSYSRLLALGLATGVIGMVINKMAGMAGGGRVVGPIAFILIFLVGHTVNLGINALGAYVHTNRLQYVEFFGKFYEGGGREFNPFRIKSKYYKIKEKMKNESV